MNRRLQSAIACTMESARRLAELGLIDAYQRGLWVGQLIAVHEGKDEMELVHEVSSRLIEMQRNQRRVS